MHFRDYSLCLSLLDTEQKQTILLEARNDYDNNGLQYIAL